MKKPSARYWYASVAILVFLVIDHLSDLLHLLNLRRFMQWQIVLAIRNFLEVTIGLAGISLAHQYGVKRAARELGMTGPLGRGVAFGLVASAPMLVAFAIGFELNPKMTFLSVAVGCFIAPFAEEVVFRGYLFRQLYQRAQLGFWLSALVPSVLFAAGHAYQSSDPKELIGILTITGLGSVLGCWLYVRWQYNLWVIVALHSAMNLWWEVFAVDDTALGGWLANGARLLTIVCAILLTIFKDRFWSPLPEAVHDTSDDRVASLDKHDTSARLLPHRLSAAGSPVR